MEADKFFPFFLFPSLLVKLDFYHNRVNYVPFVQEIDPNPKFGIVFKFRDTNIFFYERTRNILQKVTTRDFSTRIEPVRTRGNKRNETRQAGFSVDESLRNSLGTSYISPPSTFRPALYLPIYRVIRYNFIYVPPSSVRKPLVPQICMRT